MSDSKVYDVLPHAAERALIDEAAYQAMYRRSIEDPDGFLGGHGERARPLVPEVGQGRGLDLRRRRRHPLVRRREGQRRVQLPRPAPRGARRQAGDPVGRRPAGRGAAHHLPGAARGGLPVRQRAQVQRRREGRPGLRLHADGARGGGGDARLRADRRGALRGVRRVLARRAPRPHPRLRLPGGDHRGRGPARRAQRAAEEEHPRGPGRVPEHPTPASWYAAPATMCRGATAATSGTTR